MARVARVVVPIDFDGARLATVEINRDALLFTVRLYRRRRTYTLPLSMVAQVVAWKVTKAELLERRCALPKRKQGRRTR